MLPDTKNKPVKVNKICYILVGFHVGDVFFIKASLIELLAFTGEFKVD